MCNIVQPNRLGSVMRQLLRPGYGRRFKLEVASNSKLPKHLGEGWGSELGGRGGED